MNDNDKENENFSRKMDELNLILKEKSEAFNKLAKALKEKSQRHSTATVKTDKESMENKPENKLNN